MRANQDGRREAEFVAVLALEKWELIEMPSGRKREVFVNGDWDRHAAYGFDGCATRNKMKALVASILHHLYREFGNLIAPEWDVSGALLQGMKPYAPNYRAFGQIDAKRELPDARVALER